MKARFENIGPIKKAELELGDLTIIAGQNNTGKTYLVYTLYGFLKVFHDDFYSIPRRFRGQKFSEETKYISNQIKKHGKASIPIEEFETLGRLILKYSSNLFSSTYIKHIFSSPNGEFDGAKFLIEAEIEKEKINDTDEHEWYQERKTVLSSSFANEAVTFAIDNPEDDRFTKKIIETRLYRLFYQIINSNFPSPFILSAERFGISLFYKELDFTKNRLVEELQNLSSEKQFNPFTFIDKGSARYARPIKDNIDFTRDLVDIQKRKSNLPMNKLRSVRKIMKGYYKAQSNEIRFISNKRKENRFDIPLHLASSSTRGVSDLYFYLKHVAQKGQILIIDEPESHLSPTNQVLMARLLAFCVNSGIKVLLTTHSDYLIKEFNNLIMLSNEFEGKDNFLAHNKKSYTVDDYLKPESVKAYTCGDGTLTPCEVDKTGIDMPVFDDAIDKINKVSNELGLLTADDD